MSSVSTCLHIPVLHEEETVYLTWDATGAQRYEIDSIIDESFEQGMKGRSWTALDAAAQSWAQLESGPHSWAEMAELPAQGIAWQTIEHDGLNWNRIEGQKQSWSELERQSARYIVYSGLGETARAPDAGRTWNQLETLELNWEQFENPELGWRQLDGLELSWEQIEALGQRWNAFDSLEQKWSQLEALELSWAQIEASGQSWNALNGWDLSWKQFEILELSWSAFELLGLSWKQLGGLSRSWEEIELLPSIGLSWAQIEGDGGSWAALASREQAWSQLEKRPARGLCWESMDGRFHMWSELDGKDTWDSLERLPADNGAHRKVAVKIPLHKKWASYRVRAWDGEGYSPYLTSSPRPIQPRLLWKHRPPCLHVPALKEGEKARLVWGELFRAQGYIIERKLGNGPFTTIYRGPGSPAQKPENCAEWDQLTYTPDCKRFFSYTDILPFYEKTAVYRIKAYNSAGSSQYLTTGIYPIESSFHRESSARWQAVAEQSYRILIQGKRMDAVADIQMKFRYDAGKLTLNKFIAQLPGESVCPGSYPGADLQIDAADAGIVRFQWTKAVGNGKRWSGCITQIELMAKMSGMVEVTLN